MLDQVLSAAGDVAGELGGLLLVALLVATLFLFTDPELRRRRRTARRMARRDREFARRRAALPRDAWLDRSRPRVPFRAGDDR